MLMMADSGEEKTEKATPKKRREAREQGQVCQSQDLSGALVIIALFWAVKTFGGSIVERTADIIQRCSTEYALNTEFGISGLTKMGIEIGIEFFIMLAPILLVAMLMGLATGYMQVGVLQMKEPLKPRWEKLNPVKGFQNMFSMRAFVNMLKSLLKFVILAYVAYNELKKVIPNFPSLISSDVHVSLTYIIETIFSIAYKLGLAYLFIGLADYGYQKWDYEKSLRMTKQEIKEEYKQMEGDPKVKGKIKQKQLQMSMLRMMAEVASADVVITNPTHYAVALKYDDTAGGAPVVLAKGKDFVALKLKEKAKEHKIKMVENKPLAQALYATVEIGEEIPPEFYAAVAEILADIYRLRRKR